MAKSRRKAGGATAGRYKPKKMGKGWAAYRTRLGFRPPMISNAEVESAKAESAASNKAQRPQPESE